MIIDRDKTAFRKLPISFGGLTLAASVTDLERLKAAEMDTAFYWSNKFQYFDNLSFRRNGRNAWKKENHVRE